jgi:GGDEF domain-containing protein
MALRIRSSKDESRPAQAGMAALDGGERSLTQLVDGVARNLPEIHPEAYQDLRTNLARLALQLRDGLPEDDKLELIRAVLREFETYRTKADELLRERLASWRGLTSKLINDLIKSYGLDPGSERALPLTRRVASLLTTEEIQGFHVMLADYLRVGGLDGQQGGMALGKADRSTANDNAAGLRGGGAATEHVKQMMEKGTKGYVVLFRLGCLDMIGKRFGWEAVQDSLMAVSAFLTHSLRSDDGIYHWSDSALLAVLNTPASEPILTTAMQRIVDNNRDITIQIGDRPVMLRVPMQFRITPISQLNSAEDLNRL